MPPAANDNQKQRINLLTAGLMIGLALIFDLLQFLATFLNIIPGLGVAICEYISIFSVCAFGVWFALVGVNYLDRNGAVKMITMIASVVVELIPFLDAIPAITFGVICLIMVTRAEDGNMAGLGLLKTVARAREGKMTDEEKVGAAAWADQRIQRDQKSAEAQRVEKVRKRNNIEDFSSPMLAEYTRNPESEEEEEEREAA